MAFPLNLLVAINLLQITWACPEHTRNSSRAVVAVSSMNLTEKFDEIKDMMGPVVTLASIKAKLKETGVFDQDNNTLTEREQKELKKLFDAVEIMMTSRARQPSTVQSVFSSLRMVERVINKQAKEGQLSNALAAKFHWDKLPSLIRKPRDNAQTMYRLNKNRSMRIFNLES